MQPVEPPSFDGDWYDEWIPWVLDHGLPPLPPTLGDDDAVPVARWVGAPFGAVLFVQWDGNMDEDGERSLSSEIEVFRRLGDRWEPPSTGGGGGWFDPPFVRPHLPPEYAVLSHFHSGGGPLQGPSEGTPSWTYSSAYGFTGTAAKTVEVEDEEGTIERPIESPLGVFIVVADATQGAIVRVRREDRNILLEEQFSPPTTAPDAWGDDWGNGRW